MKFISVKITFVGIVLFISCLINVANSSMILDTDNDSFIDISTNLEWMDFGINVNQSYDYVASQLGVDGIYEGWAIANRNQVSTMLANAFMGLGAEYENLNHNGPGELRVDDGFNVVGSVIKDIQEKMGTNITYNEGTSDEYIWNQGFFVDGNIVRRFDIEVYTGSVRDLTHSDYVDLHNQDVTGWKWQSHTYRSTMLVKSASVPEPTTLTIFALGIMGLGIRRLKNNK